MLEELRELYQEIILDHGRTPRNFRHPENASRHAQGHNPMCGDALEVFLVVDDQGVIEDVAFEGQGCAISIASASLMTETLKGKTVDQAVHLFEEFHKMCTEADYVVGGTGDDDDALERLQVLAGVREFPIRVKCATLAWHTMNAALTGDQQASTE